MVLDEFPYLLHGSPELASAIQAVYDDTRNDPAAPLAHLVLCGSAFTIMSELLSGAQPLRGRSRLDLVVPPFDYRTARLDHWLIGHVLNPAHALFGETDYLLREDPTITDRALYQSVLTAIAGGKTTPGGIAAVLGRDARSLWHPLEVLQAGGFVRRSEDVLTQRRPIYT
ncbi:MAG: AAA family ATPase, partial [Gemmatimonadales bacterium]